MLALPRATLVHKYNTFANFCGTSCLRFVRCWSCPGPLVCTSTTLSPISAVQLAYFVVCYRLCPGPLLCTGTSLSPVYAVQLAYLFVCCWLCPVPLVCTGTPLPPETLPSFPTCSCVVGIAPGHFGAQVQHFRQFLRSSLPTFSCVAGLAPSRFCAQVQHFRQFPRSNSPTLFVCCWPCTGPILFTGTTLSPVSVVQLAYCFCVVGLAPGHFCAQV